LCASVHSAFGFVNGADVSWISEMDSRGYKWYNSAGVQQDVLTILKGYNISAVRLRVWVNPSGGWNGQTDTVNKAVRAMNAGMQVMIDFHYSDSWADPGQQTKPAAWSTHGISQLYSDVYNHTQSVLNALKAAGVTPTWVQVGNETDDGMLWEDGRASTHISQFAGLITSGHNAVKSVFPSAITIVHISRGYDNARFRSMFDRLTANNAKFDAIGISLYPSSTNWSTLNSQCYSNMLDMKARYNKPCVICEIGMDYTQASACKSFISDLVAKSKAAGALGVFYWEPQVYNWGYNKGAWGTDGRPTIALEGFGTASTGGGTGSTFIKLQNRATGLFVDGMGRTTNGSIVGQYASSTSGNQQWALEAASTYYKLKNSATGLYIDGQGSTTNGSPCGQWSSSTSTNQQWTEEVSGSYVKYRNRATGLYMDGAGRTTNGSDLGQWASSTSTNQQFSKVTP
jgi:arabinogalactan endo-1,4-beta-galactosidase